MNTIKLFCKLLLVTISFIVISSCTTEDILPALELSLNSNSLSEDNGSIVLTATLNGPAEETKSIPISVQGTATLDQDYSISASEIIITSGSTSGSITITGNQDQQIEGVETLIFSVIDTGDFLVLSGSSIKAAVLDDDSDSDGDGVLDANDLCPNEAGVIANNGCPFLGFLINEVLYDPPADLPGDANGDGVRDANGDEFIEFFNSGPEIDLFGYTISDATQLRHTFPQGTIVPMNGVIVVFGSGTPTGNFGGAIVQTASEGLLNMNNSGDFVTVRDASGNIVLTFDVEPLSNNPNESYTRSPDLTGDFVQHAGIPEANGALFTPGTKIDGSNF